MRVLLFGATGMVGQGVLRECLLAADVQEVVAVGRTPLTQEHGKLHQVLHNDMLDFQPLENLLQGFDACFFCLGVSSAGMKEARYTHLTYDLTLVAAAYNAGIGAVTRYQGVPPYAETQTYVEKVRALHQRYQQALGTAPLRPADSTVVETKPVALKK